MPLRSQPIPTFPTWPIAFHSYLTSHSRPTVPKPFLPDSPMLTSTDLSLAPRSPSQSDFSDLLCPRSLRCACHTSPTTHRSSNKPTPHANDYSDLPLLKPAHAPSRLPIPCSDLPQLTSHSMSIHLLTNPNRPDQPVLIFAPSTQATPS